MRRITISKEKAKEIIDKMPENGMIVVMSDEKWPYPDPAKCGYIPDQNNCTTLDLTFMIEKRAGTVIYLDGLVHNER